MAEITCLIASVSWGVAIHYLCAAGRRSMIDQAPMTREDTFHLPIMFFTAICFTFLASATLMAKYTFLIIKYINMAG